MGTVQTAMGTALIAGVMINPTSYEYLRSRYAMLVGWTDGADWAEKDFHKKALTCSLYVPFWILALPLKLCNMLTGKIWNTTSNSMSSAFGMVEKSLGEIKVPNSDMNSVLGELNTLVQGEDTGMSTYGTGRRHRDTTSCTPKYEEL